MHCVGAYVSFNKIHCTGFTPQWNTVDNLMPLLCDNHIFIHELAKNESDCYLHCSDEKNKSKFDGSKLNKVNWQDMTESSISKRYILLPMVTGVELLHLKPLDTQQESSHGHLNPIDAPAGTLRGSI